MLFSALEATQMMRRNIHKAAGEFIDIWHECELAAENDSSARVRLRDELNRIVRSLEVWGLCDDEGSFMIRSEPHFKPIFFRGTEIRFTTAAFARAVKNALIAKDPEQACWAVILKKIE